MQKVQLSQVDAERRELLERLEACLDTPMLVMGFVWLVLLVVELVRGLSPWMETLGTVIWLLFVTDFFVRLALAPSKKAYLEHNWLVAVSLLVPALRIFRIARAVRVLQATRAARGLRLVKLVTALNRGTKSLGRTLGRRGFGYVLVLSIIVTFAGAAGMYAFENETPNGLATYGDAVWWTAMVLTSMGSEFWPKTSEGRTLCFILALYGFAVFGYVTATLASFFVDRDASSDDSEVASATDLKALRDEIRSLRRVLDAAGKGRA